jgi:hypothetical protein
MTLPEHWQPSSEQRIKTWLAAFAALTATAIALRSKRT